MSSPRTHPPGGVAPSLRARPALTIVVPALNEEAAIASTLERCLAARGPIQAGAGLDRVDIVVVSDGSSDRTAEIAASYSEVDLIVFERNQGYGAAIQAGWRAKPNELLGFIDADGTCDPLNFAAMCGALQSQDAEMVLGSRMGPGSRMPAVRRLGNALYAVLLRLLSQRDVRDAASGMRVIRRSALPLLLPLPDGLHFTPALSARALLEDLRIVELPMSYQERIGRSKLSVVRDGLRFLRTILATTLYVRPSRVLLPACAALFLLAVVMMCGPSLEYAHRHSVEDWLIYRVLLSGLLVAVASLLAGAAYLIEQLIAAARGTHARLAGERREWWTRVSERLAAAVGTGALLAGFYLAWPAIVSYAQTRTVTVHWSRVVVAMFCELLAVEVAVLLLLSRIVRGVARQQAAWLAAAGIGEEP